MANNALYSAIFIISHRKFECRIQFLYGQYPVYSGSGYTQGETYLNTEIKREMTAEKRFYTAHDVSGILGVSMSTAYREIKKLNDELKTGGYITIAGKVPIKFFEERLYC